MLDEDFIEGLFGKVKITDVAGATKVHTRRERNKDGSWQMVTRELAFRRPLILASGWKRLFHFFFDMYLVPFVLFLGNVFVFRDISMGLRAWIFLASVLLYFILSEFFLQKTIPKFLTRSIVVDEYGLRPAFEKIVLRTLIRFIPFEPFSALGDKGTWHDRWTKTYVLHESELEDIRRALLFKRT
jgi:hypothetical protein